MTVPLLPTAASTSAIRFGSFELRPRERLLLDQGQPLRLGTRAFDLLLALVTRRQQVVAADTLRQQVWPGRAVEDNNLRVQLTALRKLLGPRAIVHHAGQGYRFTLLVDGDAPTPADSAPAGHASHASLPFPPMPPLGREADRQLLLDCLAAHSRVTLTGPAGVGKTTLANDLAHALRDNHADGVWWVDLATLPAAASSAAHGAAASDPAAVVRAVAQVLQLKLPGQSALAALGQHLAAQHVLLVLDNCEHLPAAVATLADSLLRSAPRVNLLATSRRPLKCAGEQLLRLGPLALPADASLAAARRSGAVALFEQRARAADPRFALTPFNVAAVTDICRALDGIALGITLAAARLPLLGVAGLHSRLGDRLRLLASHRPDLQGRHRSLLGALDWSFALLAPAEQAVLRRLGVFADSCALDAVQAVAGDATLDDWAVMEAVEGLIDHSLLQPDAGAWTQGHLAPRYTMHETVRAYARAQLDASGEAQALRQRHARHMLALAQGGAQEATQALSKPLLPDRDHDNLRAALDWAARHDIALALQLAAAAGPFWRRRGHHAEARQRGAALLAHPGAADPAHTLLRGELHLALCAIAAELDDHAALQTHAEAARATPWPAGRHREPGLALAWLATRHLMRQELDEAQTMFRQALAHCHASGEREGLANVLNNLAWLAMQDQRLHEVRPLLDEAMALGSALGSRWSMAVTLENLGELCYLNGDNAAAHGHWCAALEGHQALGHLHRAALVQLHLALALCRMQRLAEARAMLDAGLKTAQRQGFAGATADGLGVLAAWLLAARAQAGAPDAAALLASAARLRSHGQLRRSLIIERDEAASAQQARAWLGEAAWQAALRNADHLIPEQAVAATFGA